MENQKTSLGMSYKSGSHTSEYQKHYKIIFTKYLVLQQQHHAGHICYHISRCLVPFYNFTSLCAYMYFK